MSLLKRFAGGELRLTRIEALSDGVFAIIVTLLVLELKAPGLTDRASVSELGQRLISLLPKFLSWLISFIIVCKFWLNHHHVLAQARHANYALVWLNSIFLMFQSFVPFPTALMGEYPENPLAVSFFGWVLALNTLLFIVLHWYVLKHLARREAAASQDPHIIRRSLIGPLFYLLGAGSAWWSVQAAFVAYLITPLFFITPPGPRTET
ncbi:MAG: TMEM175 family protein [Bryobacteraceae bacterium]|nr:TMEM175 family protein [Bryobacteraceae bacterium]